MNSTEDSVRGHCNSSGQFPPPNVVKAFLPLIALALASCVITYRDVPAVNLNDNQVQGKAIPIYYNFAPDSDSGFADNLRRAFARNVILTQAIETSAPPQKGIYCTVEVTEKLAAFSGLSIFNIVLPGVERNHYYVQYDLYIDMEKKKAYRYEFFRQTVYWGPLALFLWVNFLTPSEQEVLTATMFQFFLDAQRDNYLATYKGSGVDRLAFQ